LLPLSIIHPLSKSSAARPDPFPNVTSGDCNPGNVVERGAPSADRSVVILDRMWMMDWEWRFPTGSGRFSPLPQAGGGGGGQRR